MKKMFLTVALVLATLVAANGSNAKMSYNETKFVSVEDVIKNNVATPNIVTFYDIERIRIKNEQKILIRIYDKNWNLILETNEDVNVFLKPGDYYIASEKKIKPRYIMA